MPLAQAADLGLGADQLGSKAATLAHLAAVGLPVPAGFVIPAVVGTRTATRRLRTGQVVTVDGTTGRIHPRS